MASTFYGADIEQLRDASRRLADAAQQLDTAATAIQHQLDRTAWTGPNAQRFRGDWSGAHRGAMTAAAGMLRAAAETLTRNAAAQEQASRADGPGYAGGFAGAVGVGVSGAPGAGSSGWSWGNAIGDFWNTATDVRDAAHDVLDWTLPGTSWKTKDFLGLIPQVGKGAAVVDAIDKLTRGEVPWHNAIDFAAGLVSHAGKSIPGGAPVAYGIAVDMRLWADVAEKGHDFFFNDPSQGGMDWSAQGMTDLWDGIRNPKVLAQTAKDTLSQLAPILAGDFKFW